MPYWGSNPEDNDFAFDAVGAYVFLIKDQMFRDMENVLEKSYPEQAIIASLKCLRLLADEFPKCVSIHFRKKHLEQCKTAFENWFTAVKENLPTEYADAIQSKAHAEFELFEEQVLHKKQP